MTHWSEVAPDPYWNDTTFAGASLSLTALTDEPEPLATALAFLRHGRDLLRKAAS